MSFGRWLSAQKVRDDWIGELARAASKDPRFPWASEPLRMQDRIRAALGGDAEALHAFQAALDEWNGGPYSLFNDEQARKAEKREASAAAMRREVEAEERAKRRPKR